MHIITFFMQICMQWRRDFTLSWRAVDCWRWSSFARKKEEHRGTSMTTRWVWSPFVIDMRSRHEMQREREESKKIWYSSKYHITLSRIQLRKSLTQQLAIIVFEMFVVNLTNLCLFTGMGRTAIHCLLTFTLASSKTRRLAYVDFWTWKTILEKIKMQVWLIHQTFVECTWKFADEKLSNSDWNCFSFVDMFCK